MQGLHRSTAALGRNLSIFRDDDPRVNRYEQHGPAANQLTSPRGLRKNRQRLPLWPECPAPASKGAARSSAGEMVVHWKVCLKPANSPRKVIHCIPLVSMAEACAIIRIAYSIFLSPYFIKHASKDTQVATGCKWKCWDPTMM